MSSMCAIPELIYITVQGEEVLSLMLLSWHNIYYYQDLMREMQHAIEAGRFAEYEASFHAMQAQGDIEPL